MSPIISIQKSHEPLQDTPLERSGVCDTPVSIEPKFSSPSVASASILFSICLLTFIFGPFLMPWLKEQNFFERIAITQIGFILLPTLLTTYLLGHSLKKTLRLNSVSFKNIGLSLGLLMSSLPLIYVFTVLIFILLGQRFERSFVPEIPLATNFSQLFMHLIFIAIFAGICEELLFRGFLMRGYEQLGIKTSILLSSTLFALMHLSIIRMPATFLLGILISFVVYRTNSLFTGMFLHICNNSFAVLLSYWLTAVAPLGNTPNTSSQMNTINSLSSNEQIVVFLTGLLLFGVFVLFFGSILWVLLKKFLHSTQNTCEPSFAKPYKKNKLGLLFLFPALVIIGFFFFQELLAILKTDSVPTL